MILYIADIVFEEKKLNVSKLFAGESFNKNTKLNNENFTLHYYRAAETLCLTFKGEFEIESTCDRCGEPVCAIVDIDEQFIVFPHVEGEDMDYTYSGETLDIDPFVHEAIVLNIPGKILCDEECKGRCSFCGIDLNEKDCGCAKDIIISEQ